MSFESSKKGPFRPPPPVKVPWSYSYEYGRKYLRRRSWSAPAIFHDYDDIGVMAAALGAQYHTSGSSSMSASNGTSRLAAMQARLREQLMVEKESRLLEMAARQEAAREGTIQRVTKSSASSLSSSLSSLSSSGGQGRVRKMFEERRSNGFNHSSPVGWDKSYPLEPVRGNNVGGGGRPPVKPKGLVRNNRGVSVDRGTAAYDPAAMKRSRSQAALQRNNNNLLNNNNNNSFEPRSPARGGLRPPQGRQLNHHKSTSSLLDANQNYNGRESSGSSGGYSRDPSREPSPAPSPQPANANRFGFRNTPSRGPSPSPQYNNSPARGAPPQRRASQPNAARQPQPPPRQPPRQAPARQQPPPRQPRKPPARSPQPPAYYEDEPDYPPQRSQPQSKPGGPKSRGPPITQVTPINNNNNQAPKPPARKPKPPPKPKASTRAAAPPAQERVRAPVPGLAACKICGRNFAPDRIEKHETICLKSQNKQKKRKVFDPVKMRTKGTEAEKWVAKGKHLKETPKPKKQDWRKKHEEFIATVRAAKGIKGYEAPPMDTSDYVQCPHCGRKFSEGAADRHIPKCASIQSNKPAITQLYFNLC